MKLYNRLLGAARSRRPRELRFLAGFLPVLRAPLPASTFPAGSWPGERERSAGASRNFHVDASNACACSGRTAAEERTRIAHGPVLETRPPWSGRRRRPALLARGAQLRRRISPFGASAGHAGPIRPTKAWSRSSCGQRSRGSTPLNRRIGRKELDLHCGGAAEASLLVDLNVRFTGVARVMCDCGEGPLSAVPARPSQAAGMAPAQRTVDRTGFTIVATKVVVLISILA